MTLTPPVLDTRVLQDVLQQLQQQAKVDVPEWTPSSQGDVGTMLQRIFARFMELAIQRLNQVPEKNLYAFLDAMGVALLPPSPAEVPLVFGLTAGRGPTIVPAGTQAGTTPGGLYPNLSFETTEDYTVIPAKLARAFTVDPVWDRSTDQTTAIAGAEQASFTPFVGANRIPHALNLGDDRMLSFTQAAMAIHLGLGPAGTATGDLQSFLQQLTWQYIESGNETPLTPSVPASETEMKLFADATAGAQAIQVDDVTGLSSGDFLLINDDHPETVRISGQPSGKTVDLTAALQHPHSSGTSVLLTTIRFAEVFSLDVTTVQGVSQDPSVESGVQSRFVQAMVTPPLSDIPTDRSVSVSNITVGVSADGLLPDFTFTNQAPQDVTKNFFPFGEIPKAGDSLYIGSQEAFSKPGVEVTLKTQQVDLEPPQLIWEYSIDGTNWSQLPTNSYSDGTANLTQSGTISIAVPATSPPAGQAWLRTRLISGEYWGAPSISKFQLVSQTTLTAEVAAGESSLTVTQANFAGQGQELLIADANGPNREVLTVLSVDDMALILNSSLLNSYPAGATVSVPGFYPLTAYVASLDSAAAAGDPNFRVTSTRDINITIGDVLRVDDGSNTEFIVVTFVDLPIVTPGVPLSFAHTQGTPILGPLYPQPNQSLNFFGFADQQWINFNDYQSADSVNPFLPLGNNPSTSDVFTFGTNIGYTIYHRAAPTPVTATTTSAGTITPAIESANTEKATDNKRTEMLPARIGMQTLTFSSDSQPQIILNINVNVSQIARAVKLTWEYLSSGGWQRIPSPVDSTDSFRTEGAGTISFSLPPDACVLAEVNGKKSYWVRVRIDDGNYGLPQEYIAVDPSNPQKGYMGKPGTGNVKPPELTSLQIGYQVEGNPSSVITQNGFFYSDQGKAKNFVPFVALTDLPAPYSDPDPAFYLGFDAVFPQQQVKLWIDTAALAFSGSVVHDEVIASGLLPQLPPLRWEYFNGTAWSRLAVLDGTNNFTESGTLDFLTPADFAPLAKFDQDKLYWMRARSSYNFPPDTQQLDGVYLNAVPAVQAASVSGEIFGSSNGQLNQTFTLMKTPVLAGQEVWVKEPEVPSDTELVAIQAEEGSGAVQTRMNGITGAEETWVRWHEVSSFLISGTPSRHYSLDHSTGSLVFGDGQSGMIPPAGLNNLSANYQNGGGAAGNLPAGAIAQVRSALPGVTSVSSPVAADGGSDMETVTAVAERGPQVLRNRGCAISAGDMESLATQADGTRIARSKCLPNVNSELSFEPGWVTVLIVPQGTDSKLVPSSELIRQVETHLASRAFIGLTQQTPSRINVIGAGYIEVTVAAEVVPVDLDEAQKVKESIVAALNAFFHPLTGGSLGTGWDFGRGVYASEVSRLLQGIAGVDHLNSLDLIPNIAQSLVCFPSGVRGVASLPVTGRMIALNRSKAALIADSYDPGLGGIPIKGFKEGDRISRVWDLKVTAVAGTTLTVTSLDGTQASSDAVGFPHGSLVMTVDGEDSVQLATAILPGEPISTITLETPFPNGIVPNVITLFYPFLMTATGVTMNSISVTVISVSGPVITVGPFSTGTASLPAGTTVTTAGGTHASRLTQTIAANRTGVVSLQVQDVSFVGALQPGDSISIQLTSQALAIEPYQPEVTLPAGSVIARLDNLIRLPLLAALFSDTVNSFVQLQGFALGDQVQVIDGGSGSDQDQSPVLSISSIEPVNDIVYLDPNFLIYSGAHQITMVEE